MVNTLSWTRTDIVRVPASLSVGGDRVLDAGGRAVPSQRLATGELAVLVDDIPPFAARRYRVVAGRPARPPGPGARASARGLDQRRDDGAPRPGDRRHRRTDVAAGVRATSWTPRPGSAMNQYLFMVGSDAAQADDERAARASRVNEPGPLVASLVAESDAPGAVRLSREVVARRGPRPRRAADDRSTSGARRPGPKGDYYAPASKESVNLAFPFNVPGGQVRLELPLGGVIRPDADQIDGSCKNWFTVGNWADVVGGRPRRHVGHARHAAGAAGRPHGQPAELADRSEGLARVGRADAEALPVADEQPLGHQLPRVPGRAGDVPLRGRPRTAATTPPPPRGWRPGLSQPLLALPAVGDGADRAPAAPAVERPGRGGGVQAGRRRAGLDPAALQRVGHGAAGGHRVGRAGAAAHVPQRHVGAPGAEVSGPLTMPAWGMVTMRAER